MDAATVKSRLKKFVASNVRQIPCLHAVTSSFKCFRRGSNYQTLGQEEGDGEQGDVEDKRQDSNMLFGTILVKGAMLCMVGITVMAMMFNSSYSPAKTHGLVIGSKEFDDIEFKRDAPVVLYLGAIEILICGACAHTAHAMYKRRRHCRTHPKNLTGRAREAYTEVCLAKTPGKEDQELFGLGFRPSSDGLECLLVEAVQHGSLLERWNQDMLSASASPEAAAAEALGDGDSDGSPRPAPRKPKPVHLGAAVVAVNDVSGDVGAMQAELLKPQVTLWVCSQLYHPSQLETEVLLSEQAMQSAQGDGGPTPGSIGRPASGSQDETAQAARAQGPRCPCLSLEDEEPQILTRWLVCSALFGWVTLLPVLLMQPHEERPRQALFRQYLLKPCVIILPLWLLLWILDCVQVVLEVKVMHPYYYFVGVHMVLAAGVIWYLFQLQAADERLVLEQRATRQKELPPNTPLVAEDPCPTLLKEFICMNPVALVWLGSCVAIPMLLCSLLTPMGTARSRMAQGYLNVIYAPCIFLQVGFMYLLYHVRFVDLPKLYLAGFGLLLSVPCFMIWCICLVCASRYGRQDMALAQAQRLERVKAMGQRMNWTVSNPKSVATMVDCSEALHREWELVYSA